MSQFRETSSGNLKIEDFPGTAGAVRELMKKDGETCSSSLSSVILVGDGQTIISGFALVVTGSERVLVSEIKISISSLTSDFVLSLLDLLLHNPYKLSPSVHLFIFLLQLSFISRIFLVN